MALYLPPLPLQLELGHRLADGGLEGGHFLRVLAVVDLGEGLLGPLHGLHNVFPSAVCDEQPDVAVAADTSRLYERGSRP